MIQGAGKKQVQLRAPTDADGARMWQLACETEVLDENSTYAYLMFARFFKETCIVAETGKQVVGFITGFCRPDRDDTLFIWQIGVSARHRGKGIAKSMIAELLRRCRKKNIRFLEATVSPSNEASRMLFLGVSREYDTRCTIQPCFSADLFPGGAHESEWTYRIGPIFAHSEGGQA